MTRRPGLYMYVVTPAALSAYPFGCPDAANEALDPSRFVTVDGPPHEATVVSPDVDPDVRVLVGRMGAGKTRCLVEVKKNLQTAGTYDLTEIEFDLPSLTHVIRLAEDLAIEPAERAEIWQKIWKRAIVRAALSRVLPRVREGDGSSDLHRLAKRVREEGPPLISASSVPHSIYAEFGAILRDHKVVNELRHFLDSEGWDQVDYCFEQLVGALDRPLCFFLDTGEDDSSHAPRYWLWCQLGLVRQVLQFTQNDRLADKLRIFVAIRDQTWAELSKAGRPLMFEMHPKVRQLRWGVSSAAQFLAAKIRELPDEHVLAERTDDDPQSLVTAWLGAATMSNGHHQADEPMSVYLLRHTRLIPRDIVSVGNLLNDEVLAARRRGDSEVPKRCIHEAVAEAARLAATEELHSCALEVIAQRLAGARTAGARRHIVPDEDAAGRTLEAIKDLLGQCDKDVVARETVEEVDAAANERFETSISLRDMLWRRGLIGWSDNESGPYTFAVSPSPSPPPRRRARYIAVHPCLVDLLALEPAGDSPVVPFAMSDMP